MVSKGGITQAGTQRAPEQEHFPAVGASARSTAGSCGGGVSLLLGEVF